MPASPAPLWLRSSSEFQKALADQKTFGTLLGQLFGGATTDAGKLTEKAGRLQKLINTYLPSATSIPKEIVADAIREVMYKSWQMSTLSGKAPDRKEVLFSLEESLSPQQMALHGKFVQIFKSKNLASLYEGKMAKNADTHIEFLAYLLVKQVGAMEKSGDILSQKDYEALAYNTVEGVSSLIAHLKETRNISKSMAAATSDMRAGNSPRKKTGKDFLNIGEDKSGLLTGEAQGILYAAISQTYAYAKIFWDYSSKAANELAKDIFAEQKQFPSFPLPQKMAKNDLFWATVEGQKKEKKERDRKIADEFGSRKGNA